MRLLYPFLLLLLLAGAAGCRKDRTRPGPVVNPPAPPAAQVKNVYCTDPAAKERDSVFRSVQMDGPHEDWGYMWWNKTFGLHGLSEENEGCVKVFIAQEPAGTWLEVPRSDTANPELSFQVFPVRRQLYLSVLETRAQMLSIDVRKRIAVKVVFKTL